MCIFYSHYFSDDPEVFLPKYSQPAILHAAHFRRVVNPQYSLTSSLSFTGRTHSNGYSLFSVDRLASKALKQFAELGVSDLLDKDSQGMRGVLDAFSLPALDKDSVGVSSGRVFVDGKHSEVGIG